MYQIDWTKYMADHHIRIGGNSNDVRSDAVLAGRKVSGSKLETKMSDNARASGGRHIQKLDAKAKAKT